MRTAVLASLLLSASCLPWHCMSYGERIRET
jgi:hypothetical protein